MEIPFRGDNIILAVLLSYRYSSARIQYTVLEKSLSSGMTFSITTFTFNDKTEFFNNLQIQKITASLDLVMKEIWYRAV